MKTVDPTFNPYQPPAVSDSGDPSLDPEVAFLVSTEVVLCGDQLRLPQVCVHTGTSKDLVRRQQWLKWTPLWLRLIRILLLTFACQAALIAAIELLSAQRPIVPPAEQAARVAVLLVLSGLIVVMLWLVRRQTRQVDAVWFVERQRYTGFLRRQRRLAVGLILCVTAFFAALAAGLLVSDSYFEGCFWTALVGLAFLVRIRRPEGPWLAGTHDRLNVVRGLSPEFLAVVLRMIQKPG